MTVIHPTLRGCVVGALACQKNSYLQTLTSEVISCTKYSPPKASQGARPKNSQALPDSTKGTAPSDLWLIEFADSVLFPEGGVQPSDQGKVVPLNTASSGSIPIGFVQRQGLHCMYHSPQPLSPGSQVRQEVDFSRRWDHMQQHTGQHVLSAIMDTHENLETLGWGMGSEGSMNYVDLPRKLGEEEMQAIQDKCNETIRNNLPITVETPDDAEHSTLPGDYDKEGGVVRVIRIGDLDRNTCCGTHLSQTSHISLILLHYTQPVHSQNTRLYFTAGDRAIKLATTSINSLRSIGKLLGSGSSPDEVISSVKKSQDTGTELRRKEKKLLLEIAKHEGDRVKAVVQAGKIAWVHHATEGLDFINMVVFEIKDAVNERGLVVLAAGEAPKGGPVVIMGEKNSVDAFATKVKDIVTEIRGGGKGGKWQGKVVEWKKGELERLQKLVESEI